MNKVIYLVFIILIFSVLSFGQDSQQYVLNGSGARAAGMGNAFTGLADDATAISWNAAGLTQLYSPEASVIGRFGFGSLDPDYQNVDINVETGSSFQLNFASLAIPFSAGNINIVGGVFPGFGNYAAVILGANPLAWFVILCPVFASVLDSPSNALWVTRPMHSMAMDRFCPEAFARVHPKYHVPHITLWFWLILSVGTVAYATALEFYFGTALASLIGVAYTYVFIRWQMALAAVSLPYYRPTLWERSGAWKFLGIPLISIGGLVSGAMFFWAIIAYVPGLPYEVAFTVLVYVIGQLAYMYYGAKNKAKGIEMSAIFGQLPPE